ncbi:hypothetical protein HUG10_19475 (plasmid) [Halorarum halophilum]|uniref:DUF7344 domain-containing protein n=1 Tax=Halorarum halophilum TaxID=2743090 RepID=A0A7D5GPB8_9EURY|nr:hypothetical protein [Halobaculum halophilum]QLG29784.1 hypothetical protein HUG10_19475 [Halobaculum halophilum]
MSESEHGRLSQNEVYDLLSNPRRRFVISYLREHGGPIELTALAREVAAWENQVPAEELTDQQEKRVYVSLYQTHIPKLRNAGVVDYDPDDGVIRLTATVDQLERYLPEEERTELPWQTLYIATAVVGGLFYLLTVVNAPGFAAVPDAVAGIVVVAAFLVVTLAQYVYSRYMAPGTEASLVERRLQ